jgi:hypothetical protein
VQLERQIHDKYLRNYLLERELWTVVQFDGIDWRSYGNAHLCMGRKRQTAISKACHNLWHTGTKHCQYYGETRPCCMCGRQENWHHITCCHLLDAVLHQADSWEKMKKAMKIWKLPPCFWTAIQKGIQFYTDSPLKGRTASMTPPLPNQQHCDNVAIKTMTIHVIEVVISITTIITYLHNYI